MPIATSATVGLAAGFLVVMVATGSTPHIPGTRTLQAITDRILSPFQGAPAYVPAPEGPINPSPRRQSEPPSEAPETPPPTDPSPTPTADTVAVVALPETDGRNLDLPLPPAKYRLKSGIHVWQTWNNCGPATVTMALSIFGRAETQARAVSALKTSTGDKNVNPDELVAYIRSRGVEAEWRMGGDLISLKRLLAADVPVIVEVGFEPHPNDWMGHYRLLVGYDDATRKFIAYDSYLGPGLNVPQPYAEFENNWRAFNRTYIPLYLAEKAGTVTAIAGNPTSLAQYARALEAAKREAVTMPNDPFVRFNIGTNLFKLDRVPEAVGAFDEARQRKLPFRMLWYQFAPFEAYLATGRFADVLTLATANIEKADMLEESYYYRGRALHLTGKFDEARVAYGKAIASNARYVPAIHFRSTLPS